MASEATKMDKIVSLAKQRGFVFPSSEIYGGLANVYDYGPLGAELLKNLREMWWNTFVHGRRDVVGLESQILMHPRVWEASGHVEGFSDPQIDCKECKHRFRADHLVEQGMPDIDPDEFDNAGLEELVQSNEIKCPNCGAYDWTGVRDFNLLFDTHIGSTADETNKVYLRPETAQGMYVQFKNVLDSTRATVPFGIGQIGKVFRNEITKGKFIFRTLEFEQMELQYFIHEDEWKEQFEEWRMQVEKWYTQVLNIDQAKFRWRPHHPDKLAHYAKQAEDYEYEFSTGFAEVSGLHYRTDFDLKTHQEHSGQSLEYQDRHSDEKYIPHVVESTYGITRNLLMLLDHAYTEEQVGDETRTVLRLPTWAAPYKVAVLPLSKKEELTVVAEPLADELSQRFSVDYDVTQSIGKRYRRQDEIGTPLCVTVDFDSLEDKQVTIRERDTMQQDRVPLDSLVDVLEEKLS